MAQAAQGGGGQSPSLEGFKKCRDVALRDVVSGGGGLGLDLVILEVFSSLNDSMIHLCCNYTFLMHSVTCCACCICSPVSLMLC